MKLKKEFYIHLIELGLGEDIGNGDITSEALIDRKSQSKAILKSKAEGIICGIDVFINTMLEVDPHLKFDINKKDGDNILDGDRIITITGRTISILKGERTALNFIQRMSGIATKTYAFSSRIKNYKTQILDTRKTCPGYRLLDKYSVWVGGGMNHRMGLYDMFLIKENHLKDVSDVSVAVTKAKNFMPDVRVEVETTTFDEVREACLSIPDVIMLDNMNNDDIKKAVNIINEYNSNRKTDIKIEASGNVNIDRVETLAKIGVDFISIGELTHSVKAFDLSLLIE